MKTQETLYIQPVFDWYQFTTQINIREVEQILEPLAGQDQFHPEQPKLKGYKWASKVGGKGGSCLIHYGGKNGDEYGPNVAGTGPMAVPVSELFRATKLPHSVGRADVRQDFLGDFNKSRGLFIQRLNDAGMATSDAGSCPESIKQLGRTVYGGSRSSAYQPTLYEKGLQLGDGFPTDYLRLEHRFSFSKAHEKQTLSQLTPTEIVGLRPVARGLSQILVDLQVEPYKIGQLPKDKDAYYWMLRQYRGVFLQMIEDQGASGMGHQIAMDLAEVEPELQH
jgi:hypothetical protein